MSSEGLQGKKRIAINSVSSVATIVVQITFLVWVNQYLLKRIDPSEYAIFPLVMSLVVFADLFKNIFTGGLSRYIVEADARGDDRGVSRVVSSMLPFLAGAAALLCLLGGLAVWKIDSLLKIAPDYLFEARLMFSLVIVMLAAGVFAGPFTVGLYAKQRFVLKNALDLGAELVRIGLLLILLLGVSTSVLWLVVASVAATLARICIGVFFTKRLMPAIRFVPSLYDRDTVRSLLGFGAWTSVGGVVAVVSRTSPLLFLNHFAAPIEVACFHVGRLPDMQLRKLIAAALHPIQPALTSLYATDGSASLSALYYTGNRYILWMALAAIAPLVVLSGPIIDAYIGGTYASAALVMAALLGRYPLIFSSAMFYRVAHATGRVGRFYACELMVQMLTLAALYIGVVVMGWGAVGAGLAIGLSAGILHVLVTWPLGLRLVGGSWKTFACETLLPGLTPFLLGASCCWGARRYCMIDTWLGIGVVSLGSFVVYVSAIWFLCLRGGDKELVRRVVSAIRSKLGLGGPMAGKCSMKRDLTS